MLYYVLTYLALFCIYTLSQITILFVTSCLVSSVCFRLLGDVSFVNITEPPIVA
jgi:hypothetical protein